MRYKLLFISMMVLMSGCSVLPGMQNVDTARMEVQPAQQSYDFKPIVKPITPLSLLHTPHLSYRYHIGPSDVLNVTVWDHPELNVPIQQVVANPNISIQAGGAPGYLVDDRGNIYFPLIGNLHVAGKTVDEVRTQITHRLNFYIRKPQVFVRVADFRSKKIYVMGEVLKAGFLPLSDQTMSITDALNLAGSVDPNSSDPRHIYVIRGSITRPEIYWLNASTPTAFLLGERFQLRDGDVVVVSVAAVTRWNRFLNQLLPTLQTVWYTKAITGK